MDKLPFFLIKLPLIAVVSFVICSILAAVIFPGTEKEVIGFQSDYYSFTHNFLSELGGLKTNPNQTNVLESLTVKKYTRRLLITKLAYVEHRTVPQ